MKCKRGDVVLVSFPMPGIGFYKPRPALVIQNNDNNEKLETAIFLQITSNVSHKEEPTQYFIPKGTEDFNGSGLKTDSVVKAEAIFTLPQQFVHKVIGTLKEEALRKIDDCLKVSLGIQ